MFWESISSHTHAFVLLYSMLWDKFSKNLVFFLSKSYFSRISIDPIYFSINRNLALKFMWASAWFNWSNLFFDQSKIVFQVFYKQFFDCFKNIFFKSFSTFLLSLTWQGSTSHFLSFSSSIFARFSSLKASKTILSLLLFLFSCFHAYFHAFKGIFGPLYFWDFWWFNACFLKLIIGFCWDIVIFMIVVD